MNQSIKFVSVHPRSDVMASTDSITDLTQSIKYWINFLNFHWMASRYLPLKKVPLVTGQYLVKIEKPELPLICAKQSIRFTTRNSCLAEPSSWKAKA